MNINISFVGRYIIMYVVDSKHETNVSCNYIMMCVVDSSLRLVSSNYIIMCVSPFKASDQCFQ